MRPDVSPKSLLSASENYSLVTAGHSGQQNILDQLMLGSQMGKMPHWGRGTMPCDAAGVDWTWPEQELEESLAAFVLFFCFLSQY